MEKDNWKKDFIGWSIFALLIGVMALMSSLDFQYKHMGWFVIAFTGLCAVLVFALCKVYRKDNHA